MLFAIDIGNSRIKIAKFDQDKIISQSSFTKPSELKSFISNAESSDYAICSVVPQKSKIVFEIIKDITGKHPLKISNRVKTNLEITYKTPETLGVDRLCSAEGAIFLYKKSELHNNFKDKTFILSIDFGTATTINVIEYPGKFVGGLIAPGLDMMFNSLNKDTAQLPDVDVSDFNSLIGKSTKSSIASGVVNSVTGMIEKTINFLKLEKSAEIILIYLTGGNAKKIIPFLNFDFVYEENLVLYGINSLVKRNKI